MPSVRVIDSNGQMLGIMATSQAQRMAERQGLDLVEITPNAEPPVCKIMDYGKFRYDESIKAKQQRKAQKTTQVKEIKFHPGTDTGDLEHKLRQIRQFLSEGNKVGAEDAGQDPRLPHRASAREEGRRQAPDFGGAPAAAPVGAPAC